MRALILIVSAAASLLSFPSSVSCDRHEPRWTCQH
jgi:hypothetical protein